MALTYEQKKAYDDYMDALMELYKLMLPDLKVQDLNYFSDELHELSRSLDEDVPDIAPWIFEYRKMEEDEDADK